MRLPKRADLLGATLLLVAPKLWSQSSANLLDSVVPKVRQATIGYASTDSARLQHFIRLRPISRIPGLNPFAGEHWFRPHFLRLPSLDLSKPGYLMFYPINGTEQLVGVGYAFNQPSGSEPPPDFLGAHPHWHLHYPCVGLPGVGSLLLGSAEECTILGGKAGETQIAMIHVWLIRNPDGEFGSENPALPYLAVGLTPPDSAAWADSTASIQWRKLGLALGETIGARPRYGTMSEFGPDSLEFQRIAGPLRVRLGDQLDSLRAAEQRKDSTAYTRAVNRSVEEWEALRQLYLRLAPGRVARLLMTRWFQAVLEPGHGAGH